MQVTGNIENTTQIVCDGKPHKQIHEVKTDTKEAPLEMGIPWLNYSVELCENMKDDMRCILNMVTRTFSPQHNY